MKWSVRICFTREFGVRSEDRVTGLGADLVLDAERPLVADVRHSDEWWRARPPSDHTTPSTARA